MAYASWSVIFGEQPSAAKWNILGTNDAYFDGYIDRAGFPIQVVTTSSSTASTGTTTIPNDDTLPQNTEGDQYMTLAITPTSATNKLVIKFHGMFAASAIRGMIAALFQDSTASALAATAMVADTANTPFTMELAHVMTSGTSSSTTFKIRAGLDTAGTMTFNGSSGARKFGGAIVSYMEILEYRV